MVMLRPTLGTNTTHACTFPADTYDFTKCCECIFVYIYYMRNIGYGGANLRLMLGTIASHAHIKQWTHMIQKFPCEVHACCWCFL